MYANVQIYFLGPCYMAVEQEICIHVQHKYWIRYSWLQVLIDDVIQEHGFFVQLQDYRLQDL